MLPVWNAMKRLFSKKAVQSPAAGTGAIGGGVIPKAKASAPGDR